MAHAVDIRGAAMRDEFGGVLFMQLIAVMVIIAIMTAVVWPTFAMQKTRAKDTAMRSIAETMSAALSQYNADYPRQNGQIGNGGTGGANASTAAPVRDNVCYPLCDPLLQQRDASGDPTPAKEMPFWVAATTAANWTTSNWIAPN